MSKVLTTKQKILRRVLLYGVLLLFLWAFLPGCGRPGRSPTVQPEPFYTTLEMQMEQVRVARYERGWGSSQEPLQGETVVSAGPDEAEQACRRNLVKIWWAIRRKIHRGRRVLPLGERDKVAIFTDLGWKLRCPKDPDEGRKFSYVLPWSSVPRYDGDVWAYEAGPFHDGKVMTLFRDGMVRALGEAELQKELTKKREEQEVQAESTSRANLRRIDRAISRISRRRSSLRDVDEVAVLAYLRRDELRCPNDPDRSRKFSYILPWSSSRGYSGWVLAYEAGPFHDGKRLVLFGQRKVRALTEEEFRKELSKKWETDQQGAEVISTRNLLAIYRAVFEISHLSARTIGIRDMDEDLMLEHMGEELRCPNDPDRSRKFSYVLPWSSIPGHRGRVVAYEAAPFHNGKRLVLFGGDEGTVRALTEDEFEDELQKALAWKPEENEDRTPGLLAPE